jgi:acyl-CoA synthetase (NDP forming)
LDQFERVVAARRRNLKRLLAPRHIVFLGGDRAGLAIRGAKQAGYAGQMFAVHPKKAVIEGVPCVPSIADLPLGPDAAFISIPADATIEAVRELAAKGAGGAVCYASGFAELGEAGRARNDALLAAAGELAVVGPNCFGVINYVNHGSLWPTGYPLGTATRGAAVVGQSGNLCINLSMNQHEVPFSYIISAGNQAVLGFEDYVDVLVEDPQVTAIGLFLEGIRDIEVFSHSCRKALQRGMPLVALRVGVSEMGARVAASHTSSLAGQNDLYDTLFERLGILTTRTVPQFLELLKALSVARLPAGRRLTVFSSSGGDNGMSADFASAAGFDLPPPSPAQAKAVKALLPDYGTASNPLDFTAGYWGQEHLLTPMFIEMMREGYDYAAIVIDHGRRAPGDRSVDPMLAAMTRAIGSASRATGLPGAVICVNPESMPDEMRQMVLAEGLVPLQGLHDAFEVLGRMADYARLRENGTLPTPPLRAPAMGKRRRLLDEIASKARLAAHGLPVPQGRVTDLAGLRDAAAGFRVPVVLKAVSDRLPHKTEAGAVALNLNDADAVVAAAEAMLRNIKSHKPDLDVDRFLIEPMIEGAIAEVLVGLSVDPHFGPVLVIGAGGIFVELLRDAARLLLPATRSEIETALRRLRTFPLLDGFRGRPKGDIPALVSAIEAIARYAEANLASLAEIDVNPIMVLAEGHGVVAADALIVETTD